MMVYLASDYELPEIEWIDSVSKFSVMKLDEGDPNYVKIHSVTGRNNVYCLLSHQGCGCGFRYDDTDCIESIKEIMDYTDTKDEIRNIWIENTIEDNNDGRSSVEQLFTYLQANLKKGHSIDMLSYLMSGSVVGEISNRVAADIQAVVLGERFYLADGQMIRFFKQ